MTDQQLHSNSHSVIEYVLSNQATLVAKVSELEKNSAVIAVEMRMMRELLEKQDSMAEKIRTIENQIERGNGRDSVIGWGINIVVAAVTAITVSFVGKL